jgi:hypothetical protein
MRVYITVVIRMKVFLVSKCVGIKKRDIADFNPITSIS